MIETGEANGDFVEAGSTSGDSEGDYEEMESPPEASDEGGSDVESMFDMFTGAPLVTSRSTFDDVEDAPSDMRYSNLWSPLLEPDDFRILLLNGTGPDGSLTYELHTVSLRNPASYHALSYAWGQAYEHCLTDTIICNDEPVRITATLHAALRRIQSVWLPGNWQHGEPQPPWWIDALCINQRNVLERSRQVNIMGRIFSKARSVVVWLEEPNWAVDHTYEEAASKLPPGTSNSVISLQWLEERGVALGIPSIPWFKRRWVIQEITLQHNRTVLLGPYLFNMSDLHDALAAERELQLTHQREGYADTDSEMDRCWHLTDSRQLRYRSLLQNLVTYREAQCSDPRDIIFALLGISDDKHGIVADYRMSEQEINLAVARAYAQPGTLHVLLVWAALTGLTSPSWVPTWSNLREGLLLPDVVRHLRTSPRPPTSTLGMAIAHSARRLSFNAMLMSTSEPQESHGQSSQTSRYVMEDRFIDDHADWELNSFGAALCFLQDDDIGLVLKSQTLEPGCLAPELPSFILSGFFHYSGTLIDHVLDRSESGTDYNTAVQTSDFFLRSGTSGNPYEDSDGPKRWRRMQHRVEVTRICLA